MKIERTKNAGRNILFGVIQKIYQIIIPFLIRTAIIYYLGIQFVGLNSLFSSILQVLNLAELGVGSAMVYSMYKPIAEDDTVTICALMKLYRLCYRVIGAAIAVAGSLLIPFLPTLVKGEVPVGTSIYVLYILDLSATVLSYWLFAYKNCLLAAHQRVDVSSKVSLITSSVQYGLQLISLVVFRNYYLFVIIALATQAATNITTALVVDKMFPNYKPVGELTHSIVNDIKHRVLDLFTSRVGTVVVNSADTIVVSAFLGLTMLALYQNYYFILKSVRGIIGIVFAACTAGIGNSIIVESKEKNFHDLEVFTFIIVWIAGFCTACLLCLYQPFMEIWVGRDYLLSFHSVICFCVYFFIVEINQLLNTYKDAAGMWHEDRFRPLATAIVNVSLNLITVRFWGLYGVLLSTVLSMLFVGMPWLLHNLFTIIFEKRQLSSYLKKLARYTVVVIIACVGTYLICLPIRLSAWGIFGIRLLICAIIPNLIIFILLHRDAEFKRSLQLVNRMTRNKIGIINKFAS